MSFWNDRTKDEKKVLIAIVVGLIIALGVWLMQPITIPEGS